MQALSLKMERVFDVWTCLLQKCHRTGLHQWFLLMAPLAGARIKIWQQSLLWYFDSSVPDLFKPRVQLSVLLIIWEKTLQKSHRMKNKHNSQNFPKSRGWDDAEGCCCTSSASPSGSSAPWPGERSEFPVWHVTCDVWRDMWHVMCDMWHVMCDKWCVTCDVLPDIPTEV